MAEKVNPAASINYLSDKEIRRYRLQIDIPGVGLLGQEKIKKAKIIVIGAGGKGSAVIRNLISSGIGTIGICDNGIISEEALIFEHLFGDRDLGKHKAIVVKQKLSEINSMADFKLHNIWLSERNVNAITAPYDILVDASNNMDTHKLINDVAIGMKKPLILGFTNKTEALVSVFNYMGGPSVRCMLKSVDEKIFTGTGKGYSSPSSVVSLCGAVMANEVIKVVLGMETNLSGKMLIINTHTYNSNFIQINRYPENFR